MKVNSAYKFLLVLTNLFACFFLGLIFIGTFSMSPEAANPLNEQQVLLRQVIYGVGISLFFSLITLMLGLIFKKKMSFSGKYLTRIFLIQFFVLLIAYAITCYIVLF